VLTSEQRCDQEAEESPLVEAVAKKRLVETVID
jgi:hypothetical protein